LTGRFAPRTVCDLGILGGGTQERERIRHVARSAKGSLSDLGVYGVLALKIRGRERGAARRERGKARTLRGADGPGYPARRDLPSASTSSREGMPVHGPSSWTTRAAAAHASSMQRANGSSESRAAAKAP